MFAYFGQNLVAMATTAWQPPVRPLQPEIYFGLVEAENYIIETKNFVNSCHTSEVMSIRRFATSLA